jgi:hypothetical protein
MTPLPDLSSYLPVAVRAWTERATKTSRKARGGRRWRPPEFQHALLFDTETTVDALQGLLFGAFRYARIDWEPLPRVTVVAEGLIYPDDLADRDPDGLARLQAYAASRKADVDLTYLAVEPTWELQLCSRADFADRWLYRVGYPNGNIRDPALVVMFNAPFDLSRLAVAAAEARADMYGGFSLIVWTDDKGNPQPWRPRILVKAIDSKRSLKKFSKLEREADDFKGHLLDLRTVVFALTGESHTLDSAAATYKVRRKGSVDQLGVITDETIDYCRRDVAVTAELLEAALTEYASHPIDLQATKAYSPASIAKAYLRAMGIQPRLKLQPDVDRSMLGLAMGAFYGGRAEVHIRHQPLPVRLVDFTSMYPHRRPAARAVAAAHCRPSRDGRRHRRGQPIARQHHPGSLLRPVAVGGLGRHRPSDPRWGRAARPRLLRPARTRGRRAGPAEGHRLEHRGQPPRRRPADGVRAV